MSSRNTHRSYVGDAEEYIYDEMQNYARHEVQDEIKNLLVCYGGELDSLLDEYPELTITEEDLIIRDAIEIFKDTVEDMILRNFYEYNGYKHKPTALSYLVASERHLNK